MIAVGPFCPYIVVLGKWLVNVYTKTSPPTRNYISVSTYRVSVLAGGWITSIAIATVMGCFA
jgi:hypothetical protein